MHFKIVSLTLKKHKLGAEKFILSMYSSFYNYWKQLKDHETFTFLF